MASSSSVFFLLRCLARYYNKENFWSVEEEHTNLVVASLGNVHVFIHGSHHVFLLFCEHDEHVRTYDIKLLTRLIRTCVDIPAMLAFKLLWRRLFSICASRMNWFASARMRAARSSSCDTVLVDGEDCGANGAVCVGAGAGERVGDDSGAAFGLVRRKRCECTNKNGNASVR